MNINLTLLFSLISFITGAKSTGQPITAELLFAGDAMQHQAQLDQAKIAGNGISYNYDDCFNLIAPDITLADYAVCNLEVPLGGGPSYSGYPCFSAPDSYAKALQDAGFDMMLTANNHCLDRGDKAMRRTLSVLDSLGIDHVGTYYDASERTKKVPFIKEIKGIKIGFLNYTYGTNGISPSQGAEVSLINRDTIAKEIKLTRKAGAELVVVAIHWGIEYVLLENSNQRSLADFLIEQGVDMIIGGHPHVIQPMKIVHNKKENKDVLVVYSLGNFISNMKTGDTRGGALVRAILERGSDGKARFISASYDTFFSAKPEGKLHNFRVIPSRMADSIPAGQRNYWRIFFDAAKRVFDKYNINVPYRPSR
jgi:poly-gamma-glutamate synthesis protein (capsule biosynthesis protein)